MFHWLWFLCTIACGVIIILYLHLPTLVLSLLRHCHSHHGNEDPVANDSDGVMFSCVGVDCRWLVHESVLGGAACYGLD